MSDFHHFEKSKGREEINKNMKLSLTQAGVYVTILGFILNLLNINIGTEELTAFVQAILQIVGLVMAWYGRYRIGDLTVGGFKK